jgi:hypothetical protein
MRNIKQISEDNAKHSGKYLEINPEAALSITPVAEV